MLEPRKVARAMLILIAVFGTARYSHANPAGCQAWFDRRIAESRRPLKRPLTVFHWFNCKNFPKYPNPGRSKSQARAYLLDRMKNSDGLEGRGLYAALDPSATCGYGYPFESACLMVLDLPASTLVDDRVRIERSLRSMAAYEELQKLGCLDENLLYADIKKVPKWKRFFNRKTHLTPDEQATLRSWVAVGAALPHYVKNFKGDHPDPLDYVSSSLRERPLEAYEYGTSAVDMRRTLDNERSMVLRPALYDQLNPRVYEMADLQDPKNPETRNIVTHLSKTGSCSNSTDTPLQLKRPAVEDPGFAEWRDSLGSQHDFSELVEVPVLPEGAPIPPASPAHRF